MNFTYVSSYKLFCLNNVLSLFLFQFTVTYFHRGIDYIFVQEETWKTWIQIRQIMFMYWDKAIFIHSTNFYSDLWNFLFVNIIYKIWSRFTLVQNQTYYFVSWMKNTMCNWRILKIRVHAHACYFLIKKTNCKFDFKVKQQRD